MHSISVQCTVAGADLAQNTTVYETIMSWGSGGALSLLSGVQGQSPGGGQGGEAP